MGSNSPARRAVAGMLTLALALAGLVVGLVTTSPAAVAGDLPVATVSNVTVTEGTGATTMAAFEIRITGTGSTPIQLQWATADGTAIAPGDYKPYTASASYAAGTTGVVARFNVVVEGDSLDEGEETFAVVLTSPNGSVTTVNGTGTIVDNDAPPTLSITSPQVDEGDTGTVDLVYTVSLSTASGRQVSVNHGLSTTVPTSSATADVDFVAAPATGQLVFPPGATTRTITVPVVGDTVDESNETVQVRLTTPVNATIPPNPPFFTGLATGTITDDDPTVPISIDDARVSEGPNAIATFTLSRAGATGRTVPIGWATADGSAVAGEDYTASSGVVVFQPSETSRTVTVPILDDAAFEGEETFVVDLSSPNAGITDAIGDGQGVGTIVDDEAAPVLSVDDVTVTEGDAGTTSETFTITKTGPDASRPITVDYATADGTATAGADYTASAGTLTFAPGETTKTVSVVVRGDVLDEDDETFTLGLGNATNAVVGDGQGVGTITDDDATPMLRVSDVIVVEGDAGQTEATFDLTVSEPSGRTITTGCRTVERTATAGVDYTSTSGTVTFAPGRTTRTVTVRVTGDRIDEDLETFFLELGDATNVVVADVRATGAILDDDAPPTLSIDDVTVVEGDTGTTAATFTVTKTGETAFPVSVGWSTADDTAVAGEDYVARVGTLTLAPHESSRTITVQVRGDTVAEPTERFLLELAGATNATVADGRGVGTILDGEPRADLGTTVSVTPTAPAAPVTGVADGDVVTWTVGFSSDATSLSETTATLTLSSDLDVVDLPGSVVVDAPGVTVTPTGADPLTFTLAGLAPGESGTITVQSRVVADRASGTELRRTATIAAAGNTDADPSDDSATATAVVDNAPYVVAVTPVDAGPVRDAAAFDVTLSEPATGLDLDDLAFPVTGTVDAGTPTLSAVDPTTVRVAFTGVTGDGTLAVAVRDDATARDASGKDLSTGNLPLAGDAVTVDGTAPAVDLDAAPGPHGGPFVVLVTLDEPVDGLGADDFSVTGGTLGSFSGAGAVYQLVVTPTATGDVVLDLAAGAATDAAGNPTAAASLTRVADLDAPTASLSTTAADPTDAASVTVDVTFSEAVTGLELADLAVEGGTLADLTGVDVARTGPAAFELTVTGMAASGDVELSVAAGAVTDPAGNPSAAAGPVAIAWSTTSRPRVGILFDNRCVGTGTVGTIGLRLTPDAATTLTATSSNPALVPTPRIAVTGRGDGDLRALVTVRAAAGSGTALVAITGTNVAGSDSRTFRVVVGANGPDRIVGSARPDLVFGKGGADTIATHGERDLVCGGPGDDRIFGGGDRDALYGQGGDDLLVGGPGGDRLVGGPGRDVVRGGPGKDVES